jgi:hypothetical protein
VYVYKERVKHVKVDDRILLPISDKSVQNCGAWFGSYSMRNPTGTIYPVSKICGSHSGGYEQFCLLGNNAM